MSESFAELFEESLVKTQMRPGSIIPGTVVQIDDDFIVVNAGLKSEGVIPSSQFMNEKGELEVAVGDTVDVAMDMMDDGELRFVIGHEMGHVYLLVIQYILR